ncbi:actin-related protein 6-like [Branchiostoma floridae x Branchiostoma belcheri]
MAPVLVLDNGAYTAKVGFSTEKEPRLIPNCVMKSKSERRKNFVGNQIEECKDLSGLFYVLPFQKGYLVNWDVQRQVWDHIFSKDVLNVNFADTVAMVTEPFFNFTSIQESMNEIFFEEYQFKALQRANATTWSAHKYSSGQQKKPLCCVVVDTGYSFTHITPYCRGKKMKDGIRRLNVGGKMLTNHLKEIISYRQLHVLDETYVMNQVKEDVCYVSSQFYRDMETAKLRGKDNTVLRDYVLPDFSQIKRGYVKPLEEMNYAGKYKGGEQIIRMANERFAVPEVLFHPSDIGIQEMGIPEAIVHAVEACPEEMHPHMYMNIILTGGNALLSGFKERVFSDLRALVPQQLEVRVHQPDRPITYAWEAGVALSNTAGFDKMLVTRQQYDEYGQNICSDKFDV